MSGSRITFLQGQAGQGAALERITARVRRTLAEPGMARLRTARRPLFTGIGASYAALALPVQQLRRHGVFAQRVLASEIGDGPRGFDTDALIAISQGGRSSETLAAFRSAPDETKTAVVNAASSPLGRLADRVVHLGGEPDSLASTVGYTGTLVALDLITGALTGRPRHEDGWAHIAARTDAVRRHAAAVVTGLRRRAAQCIAADVVAAGTSRASAEEGALLLREVARMAATAAATRNYLHGSMESAGNTLHVIIGAGREIPLARSLAAAGHCTLLITTARVEPAEHLFTVRLPGAAEAPRVVLEAVVLQELAAQLGAERGIPVGSSVFRHTDTKEDTPPAAAHESLADQASLVSRASSAGSAVPIGSRITSAA
ncbi:SIS domain-containing protein [Streptomyces bambusae]|uniref:SIS domain-containing protein n=1 Tax=Streptomyces bambusae TaxID=1550616 RepID=UPI001CFE84F2|nr:SIS domain-containing protein [Streptomyces bambusae]MCB5164210.1 SIS domain-containing protein [Streptomyces bambusae]